MLKMEDIIREGHPTLREVASQVDFPLNEETKTLAQDMLQFLKNSQDPETSEKYDLRPGVGIAAPQVNISKRFIAVHLPGADENDPGFSKILFNPRIISHSVQQTCLPDGEGCLSVDRDVEGFVPRYKRITVEYTDIDGNKQKERLREYPSVVIQHEIDHLNGVMFYDRIDQDNPLALPDGMDLLGVEQH